MQIRTTEEILKDVSKGNKEADIKVISLGVGVQSTAVYLMSSMEYKMPRADVAIFSDPGAEGESTYKLLEWLKKWQKENNGIPIVVTNEKNLYKDIIEQEGTDKKISSMPLFSDMGGMVMRQCTQTYKIHPVIKATREILGIKPRKRMKPTEMWLGISTDEIQRVKKSGLYNIEYFYPLIYNNMSRLDCINFFKKNNFPIPDKSGCVFCPFTNNKSWIKMKKNKPKDFQVAINADNALRNIGKKIKNCSHIKYYIHPSLKPLEDIEFEDNQMGMFDEFDCEGHCGL